MERKKDRRENLAPNRARYFDLFVRHHGRQRSVRIGGGRGDVFPRHAQSALVGCDGRDAALHPVFRSRRRHQHRDLSRRHHARRARRDFTRTRCLFFLEYPGGVCGLAARDRTPASAQSRRCSRLAHLLGLAVERAGRADGGAAVGHRQNYLRSCGIARRARRVYRAVTLLVIWRADQHHRADDKASGEQDARRDNFLAERIAEEDRDQRIDVVLRRRDVVARPELGKIAAKIPKSL